MKLKLVLLLCLIVGLALGQTSTGVTFAAQNAVSTSTVITLSPARSEFTAQVNVTGGPATCTIALEGSLDNASWFNLSGDQTCTSSLMVSVVNKPMTYVRSNLKALSGGTAPTAQMIVTASN